MRNPYEDIKSWWKRHFYVYLLGPKDAVFTKMQAFFPEEAKRLQQMLQKQIVFDFTSTLDNKPWNAISTGNGTLLQKALVKCMAVSRSWCFHSEQQYRPINAILILF